MKGKILWLVGVFLVLYTGCEKNVTGIYPEKEAEPERTDILYYQANGTEPFDYVYLDRYGNYVSGSVTVPTGNMYMWQHEIPEVASGEFMLELHGHQVSGAIYYGVDLLVSASTQGQEGHVFMFARIGD
jgi:hypothetical protein